MNPDQVMGLFITLFFTSSITIFLCKSNKSYFRFYIIFNLILILIVAIWLNNLIANYNQ